LPGSAWRRLSRCYEGGEPNATYLGLDVNRAARIGAAAHGGQVLLSSATAALVERNLPAGTRLQDLGQHRLKDLSQPEHHRLVTGRPMLLPVPYRW
jgi:class 3 adenylate cyclase